MIRFLAWQVMDNPFEGARQRHASAIDVENRRLYITGGHLLVGRPSTDVEVYFDFKKWFQQGLHNNCTFVLLILLLTKGRWQNFKASLSKKQESKLGIVLCYDVGCKSQKSKKKTLEILFCFNFLNIGYGLGH